ncbi:hypothetical protein LINPERHAP1_LOCUS8182 [Linum perenne]
MRRLAQEVRQLASSRQITVLNANGRNQVCKESFPKVVVGQEFLQQRSRLHRVIWFGIGTQVTCQRA